ncbi:peptidase C13 family-domain-containing protein [Pisolithus microcarpus]|nr:peptidase C13 family-domain-containing protein [Pisolithus microcarpus]
MQWLQHLSRHCLLLLACLSALTLAIPQEERVSNFFGRHTGTSGHTNNWAVLVCASRYWFNYRHMANALGMYRTVKRLGIPDSNIILMLADDTACNARNQFPGSVYAKAGRHLDLYGDNIEVDYRGYEVTVENFIRLLTGRVDPSVPRSKRLLTDDRSNIFVYMTGHGGNEFLKFQDNEEISAFDIADAFEQMWQKKRYNEILFMIDTCQANTMYSQFYSPNILATGSSEIGENSYSHENDNDIGVSVIDSYTHFVLEFMEGINKTSQVSMQDLFSSYDPVKIRSHPGVRSDLFQRPLESALITDFFGGVSQAEIFPVIEDADTTMQHIIRVSSPDHVVPPDPVSPQAHNGQDFDKANATAVMPQKDAVALDVRWRDIRKWTSIVIVGFLVGWVSLVR